MPSLHFAVAFGGAAAVGVFTGGFASTAVLGLTGVAPVGSTGGFAEVFRAAPAAPNQVY